MITRRQLLASLCALPFVGKLIPQTVLEPIYLRMKPMGDVWYSAEPSPPFDPTRHITAGRGYMRVGDRWFKFEGNSLYELRDSIEPEPMRRPRLTFAEWDRKYQQNG